MCLRTKIKARCEHGNIHHLHQRETTEQAIEKLLTGSPLNQMHRQQLELTNDLLLQGHWGKEDAARPFCFTSTEASWPIRDGDRVGRGRESERLDRGYRPKKTGETVDRR